jgi:hypothetical protein
MSESENSERYWREVQKMNDKVLRELEAETEPLWMTEIKALFAEVRKKYGSGPNYVGKH